MEKAENSFIVIPAFNEESVIGEVLGEIQKCGYSKIIVIDDGSSDNTKSEAQKAGAIALRHKINRGKGAATKTGIEAAKRLGAAVVITMDGDGQHDPKDIGSLTAPIIKDGYDVVLGSRLIEPDGMPWIKIIQNKIGNFFTWYLFGLWVSDSQSGFRAYSKKAMDLINTRGDRYEYDSEIIREIYKNRLKYKESSIAVRYTGYSTGKIQKQGPINGIKTLYKMIWKIIS